VDVDVASLSERFRTQEELVFVENALPAERLAEVQREVERFEPDATRVHVPFVRRAGTVGGRALRAGSSAIAALYRDLVPYVASIVGQPVFEKDPDDEHGLALYSYRAGDFMNAHYDRCGDSYGAYSVTIGVVDESRSQLRCTTPGAREFRYSTRPGSLTILNGSRISHAVSRLGPGERRIVLSAGYRTAKNPNACRGWQQSALELAEHYLYFGVRGLRRPRG
jgi:hypothetical protein